MKRLCLYLWLLSFDLAAETRIAILDFELKDQTMAPRVPSELKRTAAIKPLLEKELRSAGYRIIDIPKSAQTEADAGVGYLYEHPDAAAKLGERFGADYLLVGRVHKPSFLFAYFIGNLVSVADGRWRGQLMAESKGQAKVLVGKAVETLTDKIDNLLDNRYQPPAPVHGVLSDTAY